MGRTDFNLDMEDPVQATEHSYGLMDQYLVEEEEGKWKNQEDQIFENKYFLSASIIETILNEEILMFYNEFM